MGQLDYSGSRFWMSVRTRSAGITRRESHPDDVGNIRQDPREGRTRFIYIKPITVITGSAPKMCVSVPYSRSIGTWTLSLFTLSFMSTRPRYINRAMASGGDQSHAGVSRESGCVVASSVFHTLTSSNVCRNSFAR